MKIPSWEGKEGVSLRGGSFQSGTTHPDTPPVERNLIFMFCGAAQAAWATLLKIPSWEGRRRKPSGWVLPVRANPPLHPSRGGKSFSSFVVLAWQHAGLTCKSSSLSNESNISLNQGGVYVPGH